MKEIRLAIRSLARTPGVTAVVVLCLALGIGANTAIFTLVNALMNKPLPVPEPQQLVLFGDGSQRGVITGILGRYNIFSHPFYERVRDDPSFQGVAAFRTQPDRLNIRAPGDESASLAWGRMVSDNYFDVLRARPVLGRGFSADDARPGAPATAVLSDNFFASRFHRDAGILGQTLTINALPVTVIGVAPIGFFGESLEASQPDLWLPHTLQPALMNRSSVLEAPGLNWLNFIARLSPGVSMEKANAAMNVAFQQFLAQHAGAKLSPREQEELARMHLQLTSGAGGISALRFRYSKPLQILFAVVIVVLLIACANVANILLARAAAREKDVAIRLSLGATRAGLVRQGMVESVVLAAVGGLAGLLLADWMVALLTASIQQGPGLTASLQQGPGTLPLDLRPDAAVLGFTLAVCLATSVLFGLVPAWRATQVNVAPALKGVAISESGRRRAGLARTLVVAQVALSLPLVAAAGLFLRTLDHLTGQDFGFDRSNVLQVGLATRTAGYTPEQLDALYSRLLPRVEAIPGVRAASVSLYSMMSGDNWSGPIAVEGYAAPADKAASSQWVFTGPRYAEVAGLKLIAGRDLSARDTAAAPKVAIVNEAFVRRYLPDQNPIGRRMSLSGPAQTYDIEIVGVVRDLKFNNPHQNYWPVAFMPIVQASMMPARFAGALEVRTSAAPEALAPAIRAAVGEVDANLPIIEIRTLRDSIDRALSRERLIAGLSATFGALAVLLACLGLYGVLAYSVSRRGREIGIRMALGAREAGILRMVLSEAAVLIAIGTVIGVAVAIPLARLTASQLHGVKPSDPATYVISAALLAVAALLAALVPARRASRTDPMTTLRAE